MTIGLKPLRNWFENRFVPYLRFSGRCTGAEYGQILALSFVMSFVMGPLLAMLCLLISSSVQMLVIVPISMIAWIVQILGLWITAACIVRRCRDAFGKVLMPLAALLGFFVAPFFILAFLGPLLPEGLADFMQGQNISNVIVAGIVLSVVTFAPGLLWLGMQGSQPNSD